MEKGTTAQRRNGSMAIALLNASVPLCLCAFVPLRLFVFDPKVSYIR